MQIPLHITIRDIPTSEPLEARIRDKVAKLELFYPYLSGCRVVLEMPHKHKHQGRLINVKIDMLVPQGELSVNRHANEDAYVAIREAFDAATRRLEDYVRMQRQDVKHHDQPLHGHVSRLFDHDGYGFIETDDGQEFYFSRDNVTDSGGFSKMAPGTEVQFIEGVGGEGFQAKRVSTERSHAR
jgi:ribosome-associated translation inhibitor RaiA/cold shock CspA family protein